MCNSQIGKAWNSALTLQVAFPLDRHVQPLSMFDIVSWLSKSFFILMMRLRSFSGTCCSVAGNSLVALSLDSKHIVVAANMASTKRKAVATFRVRWVSVFSCFHT